MTREEVTRRMTMQNELKNVYPDICTKWCRNWGRNDCPASSKCMAQDDKPFFRPFIPVQETRFERWCRKRRIRNICKANNYNCADCIYHEHIFEDGIFYRGTKCRLEYAWNRRANDDKTE